jgi:hypothetical protein
MHCFCARPASVIDLSCWAVCACLNSTVAQRMPVIEARLSLGWAGSSAAHPPSPRGVWRVQPRWGEGGGCASLNGCCCNPLAQG